MEREIHQLSRSPVLARALVRLCNASLDESDAHARSFEGMRGVEFHTGDGDDSVVSVIVMRKEGTLPSWAREAVGGRYVIESRRLDQRDSLVVSLADKEGSPALRLINPLIERQLNVLRAR